MEVDRMGLGSSLFLIAVGAILRFAISVTTRDINLHTVGVILMIVGAVGFVISVFWMAVWADRRREASLPPAGTGTQPTQVRSTEPRY
jgi:uncharacterized membrane protein